MKIDLLKDRGILGKVPFLVSTPNGPELSEDELIAETLRRRHAVVPEPAPAPEQTVEEAKTTLKKVSTRNVLREFVLLIILLAVTTYYLYDKGLLGPYIDTAKGYWVTITNKVNSEVVNQATDEAPVPSEEVLGDDLFNALMPMTDDIAALADSIATIPPESLYVEPSMTESPDDSVQEYLPVAETPIELSDDDISIINNRSMLLMTTELINDIPEDIGIAHLFVKRDALTFSAVQGGQWVSAMKSTLDKFVLGSFDENYSSGNVKISSKFEIIINAEQDFQAQVLDEMRLLDVLAHPFNKYLKQIILDLPRGVNDNPAKFTFGGNPQEVQYILSSWAETRANFLLRSVDIEFQKNDLILSFDVIFFNYNP